MKFFRVGLLLAFGFCVVAVAPAKADAQKSTVRGAASAAKDLSTGVVSDVRRVGRIVVFPVRHPKRTAHGIVRGVEAVGTAGAQVLVAIIGPGVSR
jgi:hypothetical protein